MAEVLYHQEPALLFIGAWAGGLEHADAQTIVVMQVNDPVTDGQLPGQTSLDQVVVAGRVGHFDMNRLMAPQTGPGAVIELGVGIEAFAGAGSAGIVLVKPPSDAKGH